MSTHINFIVYVLLSTLIIIEVKSRSFEPCGVNEEYSTCGIQCQKTCADRNQIGKLCNHMCDIGCFCKRGYVRQFDKTSSCIEESECG